MEQPVPTSSIAARFVAAAARDPDHVAVATETEAWTYRELADRVQWLAAWLARHGAGPGHVVAIEADRRAQTAWAVLATLATGAAFSLIDAGLPARQRSTMRAALRPVAWLGCGVDESTALEIPSGLPRLALDEAAAVERARQHAGTTVLDRPDERGGDAYRIFTSGTTGAPKIVAIRSAALGRFLDWHADRFALGPADRFAGLASIAHAPFVRALLAPLTLGATLVLPPAATRTDPAALAGWLARQRITIAHVSPALGEVLAQAPAMPLPALRWLLFSGEPLMRPLTRALAARWPTVGLVNCYAASETPQIIACHHVADAASEGNEPIPIGRPIDGAELVIADPAGQRLPVGTAGEICVRARDLPDGYVDGRSGGFAPDPFDAGSGQRWWRSGDRGRDRGDGTILYLGRLDDQLKIRGYRVEPVAVETSLVATGMVGHAAVAAGRDGELIGYVDADVTPAALRAALADTVPDYMIPTRVLVVTPWPLSPNGKTDRRVLASRARPPRTDTTSEGTPAQEIERRVTEVWRSVLGAQRVERDDNFFDLGGHSLNAIRISSQLRDALGIEVPIRSIFECPTVAELARWIGQQPRLARA